MTPTYRARLCSRNGDLMEETTLPFVPFVGLFVTPLWANEYLEVTEVYWNLKAGGFDVYLDQIFQ